MAITQSEPNYGDLCSKHTRLETFFSMEGGDGDTSYARNARIQAYRLGSLKPVLEEAIETMRLPPEGILRITDLGCSSGKNTLNVVDSIVKKLQNRYISECMAVPEFQVFFSDLTTNDFNSLFLLLNASAEEKEEAKIFHGHERPYFVAGVPGSFYKRLFPKGSLHFVHSSYSLHWLSQIPDEVMDEKSPAYKKGRVYIHNGPQELAKAYARQFYRDFRSFLNARAEEMESGGSMFLTLCGRIESQENKQGTTGIYFGEHFESAWDDLISEGLIDAAKRDSFYIPAYSPSALECKALIESESFFDIAKLEARKNISFEQDLKDKWMKDPEAFASVMTNDYKSICLKLIQAHIGEELSEKLFERLDEHLLKDSRKLINQLHSELVELVIVLVRK